jgi:hypothetical protein
MRRQRPSPKSLPCSAFADEIGAVLVDPDDLDIVEQHHDPHAVKPHIDRADPDRNRTRRDLFIRILRRGRPSASGIARQQRRYTPGRLSWRISMHFVTVPSARYGAESIYYNFLPLLHRRIT